MIINSKTLEVLLRKRGLNQRGLAEEAGVSVKTISRIKHGFPANRSTLAGIVRALNTTAEELAAPPSDQASAAETLKAAGYRRLATYISGHRALQYALVEARYGVTPKALIELGPLLLTLLAEMSLEDRRARLTALEEARKALGEVAPPHLHGVLRAEVDFDEAVESEEASIAAADIRGVRIEDGEAVDDSDLFIAYLQKVSAGLDGSAVEDIDGSIDWPDYDVLRADLSRITNDTPLAEHALSGGHARIKDIPEDLRAANRAADRAAWLAAQVPDAAKLEWEAQNRLFDDLLGPMAGAGLSMGETSDE